VADSNDSAGLQGWTFDRSFDGAQAAH
jgi:hypothetical protein